MTTTLHSPEQLQIGEQYFVQWRGSVMVGRFAGLLPAMHVRFDDLIGFPVFCDGMPFEHESAAIPWGECKVKEIGECNADN
jgi:hypothetical protein